MPKGPLFENRGRRELVIAIVMGLLLVICLGGAALITGAGLGF